MPFFQFFTTLPATKIPKDFLHKTAVLLHQTLKNKPLERICVHVIPDQNIYNGSDPNGKEDNAYAVLRSIGSVSPDDNRKTVEVLSNHVTQELGINKNMFKVWFIDLDPNMSGTNGKLQSENLGL